MSAGRRHFCRAAAGLLAASACGCAPLAFRDDAGWITLLDGSGFDRWWRVGNANWRVADGVVRADAGEGFLVSKQSFADVAVRAEFRVDANTNSGVFLRCQDPQRITPFNSYEVNIWDASPNEGYATASIVARAKVPPTHKAAGRWNTFEIIARGPKVSVSFNGVPTAAIDDARHERGPLAVQYAGGGAAKFRRVQVKLLKAAAPMG